MQIVPLPPVPVNPVVSAPQQLANVLPQVQTQAIAPIGAQAVVPTSKGEKGNKSRLRDEEDGPRKEKRASEERGGQVNFSV